MAALKGSFQVLSVDGVEIAYQTAHENNLQNEALKVASKTSIQDEFVLGNQMNDYSVSGLVKLENSEQLKSLCLNQSVFDFTETNEQTGITKTFKAYLENYKEISRDLQFVSYSAKIIRAFTV